MRLRERLDRLTRVIEDKNLGGLVLFGRASIRYITDMRWNVAAFSVLAIRPSGEVVYGVPVLDHRVALDECWLSQVGEIKRFPEDIPNYLDMFKGVFASGARLGVDLSSATASQMHMLGNVLGGVQVDTVDEDLLRIRAVKDADEIERLRVAARIADVGMQEALGNAGRGVMERGVSLRAKFAMEMEGAEGVSFEPFAMSGPNSEKPRRYSTDRVLEDGDLVIFDMGGVYKGYCSDITRTFSVGELKGDKRDLFHLALHVQQETVKAIRPGLTGGEVDEKARGAIREAGFGEYFPHLTGHGVGLDVHEMPILDKGSSTVLEPGMVVTVEPGIYVPGLGAARVEDMVLVTETGFEMLTRTRREITV